MMRAVALCASAPPAANASRSRPIADLLSCSGCRRAYTALTWTDLPRVRTLSAEEVHRHVVDWHDERVIEVRACICGRPMARTVRMSR